MSACLGNRTGETQWPHMFFSESAFHLWVGLQRSRKWIYYFFFLFYFLQERLGFSTVSNKSSGVIFFPVGSPSALRIIRINPHSFSPNLSGAFCWVTACWPETESMCLPTISKAWRWEVGSREGELWIEHPRPMATSYEASPRLVFLCMSLTGFQFSSQTNDASSSLALWSLKFFLYIISNQGVLHAWFLSASKFSTSSSNSIPQASLLQTPNHLKNMFQSPHLCTNLSESELRSIHSNLSYLWRIFLKWSQYF